MYQHGGFNQNPLNSDIPNIDDAETIYSLQGHFGKFGKPIHVIFFIDSSGYILNAPISHQRDKACLAFPQVDILTAFPPVKTTFLPYTRMDISSVPSNSKLVALGVTVTFKIRFLKSTLKE